MDGIIVGIYCTRSRRDKIFSTFDKSGFMEYVDLDKLNLTRLERAFIDFASNFHDILNLPTRFKQQHLHNMLIRECAQIMKKTGQFKTVEVRTWQIRYSNTEVLE